MKYKTVIETDDYKGFGFYKDGNGKYMIAKDAGAAAYGGWIPLYFTECEQEHDARENICIPYLMHKQMNIPISECQKAYDVAIDYLKSSANVKG